MVCILRAGTTCRKMSCKNFSVLHLWTNQHIIHNSKQYCNPSMRDLTGIYSTFTGLRRAGNASRKRRENTNYTVKINRLPGLIFITVLAVCFRFSIAITKIFEAVLSANAFAFSKSIALGVHYYQFLRTRLCRRPVHQSHLCLALVRVS